MAKLLKVILFANSDWYLYNFRLPLAKELKMRGFEVVLMSPPGAHVNELKQEGFRYIEFPLSRRSVNPLTEFKVLCRLVQIYWKERPVLVHHFTIKCVIYGSLAAHIAFIKHVLNAVTGLGHIFVDNTFKTKLLRVFVKILYKLVLRRTMIVFQNPDDQLAFTSHRLVHIRQCNLIRGSGVDVEKFIPLITNQSSADIHIVFAGRLLWSKGLGELMHAADLLSKTGLPLKFIIAGEEDPGNPAAIPTAVLREWKNMERVQFIGNQKDMATLFQRADIVVLPSYREGVPRVLLEAAACGKPLIATDVPGCREIVKHGVNGLLVPVKDVQSLCEAIIFLINDTALREAMGHQSRKIACEEFSEDYVIGRTVELYPVSTIAKIQNK